MTEISESPTPVTADELYAAAMELSDEERKRLCTMIGRFAPAASTEVYAMAQHYAVYYRGAIFKPCQNRN